MGAIEGLHVLRLEQQIEQAEQRLAAIRRDMELPEVWGDGAKAKALERELRELEGRLTTLTGTWETEAAKLEAMG